MILSGALITNAEELLKMGLSPSEVAEGYEMACEKALSILPGEGRGFIRGQRSSSTVNYQCSVNESHWIFGIELAFTYYL